jgi:hypothetical protein
VQLLQVAGGTAGDAFTRWSVSGVTEWALGADNSDGDALVLSQASALGTLNCFRVDAVTRLFEVINGALVGGTTGLTVSAGDASVSRSDSGSTVSMNVSNTSNTASSRARLLLQVAGASAGDAQTTYSVNGVQSWAVGLDNSNNDAFVISASGALGSSDVLLINTGGVITTVADSSVSEALLVQNTNATPFGLRVFHPTDVNGTGNWFFRATGNVTTRAEIRSNGGLANFSANNVNLSDRRMKKTIKPAGSYWDKFKAIEIVSFLYKDQTDSERNLGVIAQQVQEVAPELIDASGFGDAPAGEAPYLAVYQTDLEYAMAKALQEAMARIERLEALASAKQPH